MLQTSVVYQDKDFLAINKPAGLVVHGGHPSVTDWLLKHYPEVKNVGDKPEERPGIVHRLDKDTSGILMAARNQKAFLYLKNLFKQRQVKKIYLALVYGELKEKEGIIDKPFGIISGSMKRTLRIDKARMVKGAITKYRVKKIFAIGEQKVSLLEVEPLTGRTHQIRVHLNSLHHPIVGDRLYGPHKQLIPLHRQFLHAEAIEFTLPSGGRLKISADLPEELAKILP